MQQTFLVYIPTAFLLICGTIELAILRRQPFLRIPPTWLNVSKSVSAF
jgi:hypothetical protein